MVELVRRESLGRSNMSRSCCRIAIGSAANWIPRSSQPPPELNYDMWQGQAATMPYCASRVHYNFRWNLAYSGGIITDWGAHMIDLAHWATGNELTGPIEVEGKGDFPPRDADLEHRDHVQAALSLSIRIDDGVVHRRAGVEVRGDRRLALVARVAGFDAIRTNPNC